MPRRRLALALLSLALALTAVPARADSGLPVPRFVTLASDEANLRTGPGRQYPVEWIFVREGLPLEVIDEFDVWRKVRDHDGVEGWVHHSLLSGRRSVVLEGDEGEERLAMRAGPRPDAAVLALAEPGVIARLRTCPAPGAEHAEWCEVAAQGHSGWLPRDALWGVYPDEAVER